MSEQDVMGTSEGAAASPPPTLEERIHAIEERLARGDRRMGAIEQSIAENTSMTGEVLDLMKAAKAGFRVAGWLGTMVRWLGYLAAAGVSLYTAVFMATHNGQTPPGVEGHR